MAQLIKADGTVCTTGPNDGEHFTLDEMQKLVGGYIEIHELMGQTFVMNEEGRIYGARFNHKASDMSNIALFGDVLIVDKKELNHV